MEPPNAVRLNWGEVVMMSTGGWRKVSMTWTRPPLKARSWKGDISFDGVSGRSFEGTRGLQE